MSLRKDYKEVSETPPIADIDDPNNPTVRLSIPHITYLGTLWESGRRVEYSDSHQFNLLQINEYDVLICMDEKDPRIIGIIDTIDGLSSEKNYVFKSECPFEFWISGMKSKIIQNKLQNMNWFSPSSELDKYKIPKSFHLKYKQGQILWYSNIVFSCLCDGKKCICKSIPRFFKVRIKRANRPTFMGEMDPPYKCHVFINHVSIPKEIWAHEIQLFVEKPPDDQAYEEIEDIFYWWILKCPEYKTHCLLGKNIPLFYDIESAYYDQKERYFDDQNLIALASTFNPIYSDEYRQELDHLFEKTFAQCVKLQKPPKDVKIRGSYINLMKMGMFVSPFKLDFRLKPFLLTKNTQFKSDKIYIRISITLSNIKDLRELDTKIKIKKHGSEIDLTQDIELKYNRKSRILYVSSFSYVCKNRHVVVNDEQKEDEGIDEDEILAEITENDVY
eukprot:329622_1